MEPDGSDTSLPSGFCVFEIFGGNVNGEGKAVTCKEGMAENNRKM